MTAFLSEARYLVSKLPLKLSSNRRKRHFIDNVSPPTSEIYTIVVHNNWIRVVIPKSFPKQKNPLTGTSFLYQIVISLL